MPIYLDPRVIEGSLHTLNDDIKHHCITMLMNGMEVSVLEHRLKDTIEELKNLSVSFNSFKNDLKHSLTQHLHPQQFSGRSCECPHSYFCSGGRYRSSPSGGVEHGSTFAACCNTPFPHPKNIYRLTEFSYIHYWAQKIQILEKNQHYKFQKWYLVIKVVIILTLA
jgi:hypothetical protein